MSFVKKKVKLQKPILMRDGQRIEQESLSNESSMISDGMRYICKMARGLSTGVLSQDEEYIQLQEKVMEELIARKSSEVMKNIEKESMHKINQHAEAHKCHQRVLDEMYAQSSQISKDNSVSFLVDDENEVYQISNNGPIGVTPNMGGRWRQIDLEELKKDIEARKNKNRELEESKDSQILDDIEGQVVNKKKGKSLMQSMAEKERILENMSKTMNKTASKKKTVSKKKNTRKKSDKK